MAEKEPARNRGQNEPSSRNRPAPEDRRRMIPGVNFEEMNFEQRRAPYNSGSRTSAERMYDKDRNEEQRTGRQHDDR